MKKTVVTGMILFIGLALLVSGCVGQGFAAPGTASTPTATPQPTTPPSPTPISTQGTPGDIVPGVVPDATALPPVTLQDNHQTIRMHVNESFLLQLGEGYDWNINVGDQSIISREVNVMVIRGAQGIYLAHKPGTTTLEATGDPLCRQSKPACGMPSVSFQIDIVVQ